MSRFSKAEAEARGWVFVHDREEHNIIESETQGRSRFVPANLRAEKVLAGGGMLNEQAESMGKLLERIHWYEEHLERRGVEQTPVPIRQENVPLNEAGLPVRSVIIPTEPSDLSDPPEVIAITDEEWSSRGRTDAIYDGEKMIFHGPRDESSRAEELRDASKREVENRRGAEQAVGPHKQLELDESQEIVDKPGGATGSVLIVREGEDTPADISERREERSQIAESARVAFQQESPIGAVAPEGAEKLAGKGVGIQERAGLASEQPAAGATVEAFEAAKKQQEEPDSGSTIIASEVRSDAQEEKAKQIRDEKGAAAADKPENTDAVRSAGAKAEEKAAAKKASSKKK